jgi:glycine/D-amino acid oxidase-like deaminating enzyme
LRAWHHGSPRFALTSVPDPPVGEGRYHRPGGTATWYGSSTERAAWAEFQRHFTDAGIDPSQVRRRIGRADARLVALDLTKPEVCAGLGVDPKRLVVEERRLCQELAELAVEAGFEAILAPSAALEGETTLAVFGKAIGKLTNLVDGGVRPPALER